MKIRWESLLTATLVVCAFITTGLVVHREFFAPSTSAAQIAGQKPVFIQDWKSRLGQGVQMGPVGAPVQLVEFVDFECPFCATFHKSLKTLRSRYPREVALSYIH